MNVYTLFKVIGSIPKNGGYLSGPQANSVLITCLFLCECAKVMRNTHLIFNMQYQNEFTLGCFCDLSMN